jgi:O-antigen/teichoic acid export membrane protein
VSASNSYRAILRSSSIMGAASVVNILSGLVRMKLAAVLLGPAGIGLIGLFQSLMGTASTLAALGFGTVGTRQIAEAHAHGDRVDVAAARRALFWGTLGLSLFGAGAFFMLREVMAAKIMADPPRAAEIGWLALGVLLTVGAGSQVALLNGLRRIGDLARVQIGAGVLGTVIGVAVLLSWRESGVVAFILGAPLAAFVLGHWYVARLPGIEGGPTPLRDLARQWGTMARLGAAFMISGLAVAAGYLVVRGLVQRELGLEALGQFQAAWAIAMTYITFVLGAMATDYYPRLTAVIQDHAATIRLVNEQTEVALLLAGPVLIAMLALAPWIIRLLYTAEFAVAADILRWQVLGDILKVMSWPLGFVLMAAGRGKTYLFTESTVIAVFVLGTFVGLPWFGIEATGIAFLGLYAVYLPLVFWLARWRIGFAWRREVLAQAGALAGMAALVMGLARISDLAAAGLGLPLAAGLGLYGLGRLGTMAELSGPVGGLAARSRGLMVKLGVRHG